MPLTLEERIGYIKGVTARSPLGLESVAAAADGGISDAAVSAGSSVAFVAGLDQQMKVRVFVQHALIWACVVLDVNTMPPRQTS